METRSRQWKFHLGSCVASAQVTESTAFTWFVLDFSKKTQLLSSEHDVGHVKLQVRATLTERPLVARNEVTSAAAVPHDESLEDRELQEVLNSVFDDDHDGPLATSHPRQPGMASSSNFF